MRALIFAVLLCLWNPVLAQTSVRNDRWLLFEGTVVEVGKPPNVVCGVTSPYRIARYKVRKVLQGRYGKDEIIVHHLFCRTDVLADLKAGDEVLVMIDLRSPPAQISPDGEILKREDKVKEYYSAKIVAKMTTCCDF